MTTLHHAEDIADDPNQEALEELARALEWNLGQFSLILARCNSANLRSHLIQQLREICPVEIREIVLDKSVKTLYSTIQAEFSEVQPQALMVCGLESVSTLDRLLTGANQVREEFRKNFHFPLVWWVTDEVLQKLIRLAPDLQSWFTTVEFEIATEELIHCIQKTAEDVFAKVLDTGAGIFLDHAALNLGTSSTPCSELESARQELESRGVRLDFELEASLEFVLGRAVDGSIEQSRHHFERSLALWRHKKRSEEETFKSDNVPSLTAPYQGGESHTPTSATPPYQGTDQTNQNLPPYQGGDRGGQNPKSLERMGCVLHSLGLWWRTYAERHRAEYEVACSRAKEYFQQCVEVFEQAQRPDLVAKFINALGEILQRLQQWDELEVVAQKALSLHQTYPDSIRLARAYGFLAEVHLAKSAWTDARQAAQTALSILRNVQSPPSNAILSEQSANLDWVRSYHQGWYLFSLARAHSALGHAQEAIAKLETAAAETKPYYDPELYIRILEELRSLYFQQGDYLQAFHIKQDQRSIEQQYGFRAFVGAGRLQPKQEVANPVLSGIATQGTVAQEIAASGRQQDVNRLVERIGRSDHKLTVIQGQSGVGKSSLVQAGLIPALKQNAIGTRDVVPVLQQVYTDWVRGMGKCLREALVESGYLESDLTPQLLTKAPASLQGKGVSGSPLRTSCRFANVGEGLGERSILEQLRKNAEQNLLTVLIFDQFEEFFFVCKDPIQRLPFYEFLRDALDVPYTKVILSLREDYLYFLLECNDRIISLDIINNNILDKTILYYLGNFSVEDAKSVIQNLTELTQFPLEPALIDALVQDLAGELGEVRPIELQVVGAQLQTEKITKLEQYQKYGPKEKLVERFLEEVVKDCGPGNEQIAKLVLYLLTDENNTRPLKTRADLELELDVEASKLDLVLEIFVKSRLVFQVPALPVDRYQLVHDYLVAFVRQQQSARLIAELEKEREQRKLTEARLIQVQKRQLQAARRARNTLTGLLTAIAGFAAVATFIGINLYLTTLSLSSAQNKEIERLVSALKVGKLQKKLSLPAIFETKLRVVTELNNAVAKVTEINRLEGHNGNVTSIAFSPDGKLIATASEDKTVKLWSLSGKELKTLPRQMSSITYVTFSPDAKLLATASKDNTIKLWSLDGKELKTWKGHNGIITSVSISPDGKLIATASEDNTIKLWNSHGKEIETLKEHSDDVTSVSFSPDGKMLASASKDKTIKLWRFDNKKIRTINKYGDIATSLIFSHDSQIIGVYDQQAELQLYDINGNFSANLIFLNVSDFNLSNLDQLYRLIRFKIFKSLAFRGEKNYIDRSIPYSLSPDGKLVASASKNNTVVIKSAQDNSLKLIKQDTSGSDSVGFSSNGKTMVTANNNNTMRLWSNDGTLLRTLQKYESRQTFSTDTQTITISSADNTLELWSINGKKTKLLDGYSGRISNILFSPDGKIIAAVTDDHAINLWRSDGTLIKTLKGHTTQITQLSFSPDSKLIVSLSDDNLVNLWSVKGSLIGTLSRHQEGVANVVFSPDSQLVASIGKDDVANIWTKNGTLIKSLKGHTLGIKNVIFSPNSKMIASIGYDNLVKLWRRDGTLIKTLTGHPYSVYDATFSPDSSKFASLSASGGYRENIIKIWKSDGILLKDIYETASIKIGISPKSNIIIALNYLNNSLNSNLWSINGIQLGTLRNFDAANQEINEEFNDKYDFSHDSKLLTYGSYDKTVKLWNLNNRELTTLQQHDDAISTVRFSPDGKLITSVSQSVSEDEKSYRIKIWDIDNNQEIKTIEANQVSLSSDVRVIASVNKDGQSNNTVRFWSPEGKELNAIQGKGESNFSFSPDGKKVAVATNKNYSLNLWSMNGTWLATIKGHKSWINSASLSPDSKMIASGSDDKTVRLWSRDGTPLKTLEGHADKVHTVLFSPDGKMIASADNKTIRLWSRDGTPLKTLEGHTDKVHTVLFSPDGEMIASADNKTIRLWSRDGTPLKTLEGHTDKVHSVFFSPDGKYIASFGEETVKLWNRDGTWIKNIESGSNQTNNLSFSPDGKTLFIGDKLYLINGILFKDTDLNVYFSQVNFSPDGKMIAGITNNEVSAMSLDLDELLRRGCGWARDYLKNNPNAKSDRKLCDDILPQK